MAEKGKVTGIGGLFFKTKNPKETMTWYYDRLGLEPNEYGSLFEFRQGADPEKIGYAQWSPFPEGTDYFQPSESEFMVNFRVKHIEELVESLKAKGVTICDEIESYSYGKFVHILDPDGRKIELWEPVDSVFTELNKGKTTK